MTKKQELLYCLTIGLIIPSVCFYFLYIDIKEKEQIIDSCAKAGMDFKLSVFDEKKNELKIICEESK